MLDLRWQILSAADAAPTEAELAAARQHYVCQMPEVLRAEKPPSCAGMWGGSKGLAAEQARSRHATRKAEEIGCALATIGAQKITLTDGRTTFTVWNTREVLTALATRLVRGGAYPKPKKTKRAAPVAA